MIDLVVLILNIFRKTKKIITLLFICWMVPGSAEPSGISLPVEHNSGAMADKVSLSSSTNIPSDHWFSGIQQQLAKREYYSSYNNKGLLQAPNRQHNLRIYFLPEGIYFHDRTRAGEPLLMSFKFGGYGRKGQWHTVSPVKPGSDGNLIKYKYADLEEWYVNSISGVEQGFTFQHRPAGKGTLELSLKINGAESIQKNDGGLFITSKNGRRFHFNKLKVVDAQGKNLPSRFEMQSDNTIRYQVEDQQAVYPITIDPILAGTPDTVLALDQVGGYPQFGFSIASAVDINADGYDDAVVGAHLYDGGEQDEGAVFVYLGSKTGLINTPAWIVESNQAGASMGYSVASAGDINNDVFGDIVVGAPYYDVSSPTGFYPDAGAAFVYQGLPCTASRPPCLSSPRLLKQSITEASLGVSVAGVGDLNGDSFDDIVVGAPHATNVSEEEGIVLIYLGNSTGIDSLPFLAIGKGQEYASFGGSVASAGDYNGDGYADFIVGAHGYGRDNNGVIGAAFIYLGDDRGINPISIGPLRLPDQGRNWGMSVSGGGDINADGFDDVVISSYGCINNEVHKVLIYYGHNSPFAVPQLLSVGSQADCLASSYPWGGYASLSNAGDMDKDGFDDVLVGIWDKVFIYKGSASGLKESPSKVLETVTAAPSGFGITIVSRGDINGDGYHDVMVGAPFYEEGQGAAFIYHGSHLLDIGPLVPIFQHLLED